MNFRHVLKTALIGLKTNRSRSVLTTLGIVIGITAIILLMAIGEGAKSLIIGQIQGLGSQVIAVVPGREPGGLSDVAQIFSDSLKEKDLAALSKKENVPYAKDVMPIVFGGENASFGAETYRLTILGASDLITRIFNTYPEEGAFFNDADVKSKADVIVIGAKVKEKLFGQSEALGQKIKIKGRNFRVVGILPKKGQVSFFNFDEMAIMPYTTAQEYILGIKYFNRITVEVVSADLVPQTVQDIKITLRNSHGITDPAKDDFFVETQADVVERLNVVTNVLTLLLVAVASISLVVGGIGIMNIMLVSVTERTREIGLRKALGATQKDILFQFLLEAVVLTLVGGILGVILGAGFSFLASLALSRVVGLAWAFAFPLGAALLGLAVSAFIGLVFGLYPARQAAVKDPIVALRYE